MLSVCISAAMWLNYDKVLELATLKLFFGPQITDLDIIVWTHSLAA